MSTDDYLAKIEELYERILQLSETIHQKGGYYSSIA